MVVAPKKKKDPSVIRCGECLTRLQGINPGTVWWRHKQDSCEYGPNYRVWNLDGVSLEAAKEPQECHASKPTNKTHY